MVLVSMRGRRGHGRRRRSCPGAMRRHDQREHGRHRIPAQKRSGKRSPSEPEQGKGGGYRRWDAGSPVGVDFYRNPAAVLQLWWMITMAWRRLKLREERGKTEGSRGLYRLKRGKLWWPRSSGINSGRKSCSDVFSAWFPTGGWRWPIGLTCGVGLSLRWGKGSVAVREIPGGPWDVSPARPKGSPSLLLHHFFVLYFILFCFLNSFVTFTLCLQISSK
jgi:hypothetical protein